MEAHVVHEFVRTRTDRAKCVCGWEGKGTIDKKKSWNSHVKRVDNR